MYTISKNIKIVSIVSALLGLVLVIIGFLSVPADHAAVEEMLAAEAAAHDGHGGGHGDTHAVHHAEEEHGGAAHGAQPDADHNTQSTAAYANQHEPRGENLGNVPMNQLERADELPQGAQLATGSRNADLVEDAAEGPATLSPLHRGRANIADAPAEYTADAYENNNMYRPGSVAGGPGHDNLFVKTLDEHGNAHGDHDEHVEHVYTQLTNKPWSALYVAAFFFFMISLGALAFYAIQYAASAGWSPLLFRVMQGVSAYLLPGGIILLVFFALSAGHLNHLWHWMDGALLNPESPKYDGIIAGKQGFLNVPFFFIRAIIYLTGWVAYRHFSRKFELRQDAADDNYWYRKTFKISAMFLVFFIVTESIMAWDWIMSFDPHWFSTLFGWYVFASMFVSGITVIALVTIYLKSRGYLEYVNDSHIHDLAKFMFGVSIFWTYLFFSQFLLIWYSNIPEEVTYFVTRIQDYTLPFWGLLAINFLFPLLILMNSDFKRINWFVVTAGIFILIGHWLDVFVMVMPSTVGDRWSIGISEIGSILLIGGIFLYVLFNALSKVPLMPKRNPFIEESKHFHY